MTSIAHFVELHHHIVKVLNYFLKMSMFKFNSFLLYRDSQILLNLIDKYCLYIEFSPYVIVRRLQEESEIRSRQSCKCYSSSGIQHLSYLGIVPFCNKCLQIFIYNLYMYLYMLNLCMGDFANY